jgi:hypothetical protein
MSENIQCLSFCFWLVSLNKMIFSSIHVFTTDRISIFLLLNNIPQCMCATFFCSIISRCTWIVFHFLTIVNSPAMNKGSADMYLAHWL